MGISKAKISLWAAFRAWRSFQVHPRGCSETAQGHKPQTSLAQGSPFPQSLSQIQQVLMLEGSLTHSLSQPSVIHTRGFALWKKGNCFNFPRVQGQISLLAQRAVNFSRGPFASYAKFVFSAPSRWKPEQLQEIWGVLAAPSHTTWLCWGILSPFPGRHHPEG